MTSSKHSLELSGEEMRRLVEQAMDRISAHIDSLPDQPAWYSHDATDLARSVKEPLPECGKPFENILDDIFGRFVESTYNTASPGYLAYVPAGGILHSAVADLIANAINRYVSVWIAAPAFAQIEANVIRWFCDMVGFPINAGGFLTTGGSLANWSAIVTARICRRSDDFINATVYTSNQTHHSVLRAISLSGIPLCNVRQIEVDEEYRINQDALVEQIHRDRNDGLHPLILVGNAGTTNTGAVDDLHKLAEVADREKLWFHVDAAYGGFFLLTERGRNRLAGIESADSIALDPSKGLFLPFGTGCVVVRRLADLHAAHSIDADYMPPMQDEQEFVDFCEISPELSRDFRGLRVWLPLKMLGVAPFRDNLDEKLDLANWATDELQKLNDELDDDIEILAEPQLSIVAFRLFRRGLSEAELTELNKRFRDRINASHRVFLTPTMLYDRYAIRICILSFRTHLDRMEDCVRAIRAAAFHLAEG